MSASLQVSDVVSGACPRVRALASGVPSKVLLSSGVSGTLLLFFHSSGVLCVACASPLADLVEEEEVEEEEEWRPRILSSATMPLGQVAPRKNGLKVL